MKRILLYLTFALFSLPVFSQVTPAEYEATFAAMERKVEALKKQFDVVLPPGEQIGLVPSAYSTEQAAGNWGREFYGFKDPANQQAIQQRLAAGRKVVFFVFDTAPRYTHSDMQAAQWNALARSFTGETTDFDEHGHGTHVGGIIAALSQQYDLGLMSEAVAQGLVKVVPIRVLNKDGAGNYNTNIFPGIDYALPVSKDLIAQGWGVVWNFSLGGSGVNNQMNERLTQAENAGVLVVAAAGNTGVEGINTPGNAPSAHASAAFDAQGQRASFSTFGPEMYMAGAGVKVMSTFRGNSYADMSGTSMGSPSVGAMLGWAWLLNPGATNRQISHYGKRVATDMGASGWDKYTGWGYTHINKILEGDATKEPKEGNGRPGGGAPPPPPDDLPTKKEWQAQVDLGAYRVLWKTLTQVGGSFRSTNLRFTAQFQTKYYADDAARLTKTAVDKFFVNRGFLLRNEDDTVNAGEWACYFLEMELRRAGAPIVCVNIEVQNEAGQWFKVKRTGAQNLKMRLRKGPEVSSITGSWLSYEPYNSN